MIVALQVFFMFVVLNGLDWVTGNFPYDSFDFTRNLFTYIHLWNDYD